MKPSIDESNAMRQKAVEPPEAEFSWEMALRSVSAGQVALLTLALLLGILFFWQAWELRYMLFALLAALMLHTGMQPAVHALERRGVNRRIGVALVYIALLLVVIGILLMLVPMLSSQFARLIERIPEYYAMVRTLLLNSGIEFFQRLAITLPMPSNMQQVESIVLESTGGASSAPAGAGIFAVIGGVVQGIFITLAVFAIGFYLTIDRDRIVTSWLLRMDAARRESTRSLVDEVEGKVGAFIRGQLILCTVIGLFSFAAYLLIGLPYAPALGALAFIFEAVPMVGPLLSAIPAVIVAATMGPDKLLWVIVAVSVIQVAENNILVPRVMDRAVGVNAMVSLLAIVAFSFLFGILGAILAIPLAATIQVLLNRYVFAEADEASEEMTEGANVYGRASLDYLRLQAAGLAQDVRKQFRASTEEASSETDSIEDEIELTAIDIYNLLGGIERDPLPQHSPPLVTSVSSAPTSGTGGLP
jgi:predicted PurR-regulated permease PerM